MLGTGAITVVDQKFGMLEAFHTFVRFFEHETCGQCGPCREGCLWVAQLSEKFREGRGRPEDLEVMLDVLETALGRTICVYPEALGGPVRLGIEHFRDVFLRAARPRTTGSATG